MKSLVLPVLFSMPVFADSVYKCDYALMGAPFASVGILIHADGSPAPSVEVTMYGRVHNESATPEALAADELVHVWLSKESPENTIEMVIYKDPKTEGQSKLVNQNAPIGREMWGHCTVSEPPK